MIRKVSFSLKYKFIVVITLLLLCTMGFYLSYALNIFKEDKSADIYSITLNNSISISERMRLLLADDLNLFEQLNIQDNNNSVATFFKIHNDVLGIQCLSNDGLLTAYSNEAKLMELGSPYDFHNISTEITKQFSSFNELGIGLLISPIKGLASHFSLTKLLSDKKKCIIHISFEKLMPLMNETLNYGTYVLTQNGNLFLKLNEVKFIGDFNHIVKEKTIIKATQGVVKFNEVTGNVIRAFSKVPGLDLIAITEINENKAFMASQLLIQKSLYFGILILSLAVIAGIIFTKRMTKDLQTLFEANIELARGNFEISPVVNGHDEIGALSDSFVDMKNKIINFMSEMKEKARIESEVRVAKLVQDSFFPKNSFISKNFEFTGFYEPATECSGDWWGYLEQNNKVTIVACDATGHGVPAALITAAAHSCLTTLKIESKKEYFSPKDILDRLNKVISSMNSEILMTAFVLEIDGENKKIKFSNASHMSPFLLRRINNEYTKEGLVALIDNNGPRLGDKYNSKYSENSIEIDNHDRIVLFSDGILEATNGEKVYGQRNFLKSLYQSGPKLSEEMILSIISDLKTFSNGNPLDDDITLICVSITFDMIDINHVEDISKYAEKINPNDLICTRLTNIENINELLAKTETCHMFGSNSIDITLEKKLLQYINSTNKIMLEDFFQEASFFSHCELYSNKDISNTIQTQLDKQNPELFIGAVKVEAIKLACDELISNAFYHSGGAPSFERGTEVILLPGKKIDFILGSSEKYLIISVKGPSSFTSRNRIIDSIGRAYNDRSPIEGSYGAGLGLYLIYDQCAQFWVINTKNKENQIICIFERFNRNKQLKERNTSFHYIEKENLGE